MMQEGFQINLLDHGYLRFIESWGSDERIIEAARMSTNKGFQGWGPKICDQCGGVGEIRWSLEDGGSPWMECPTCKKTGKVPGDEKLLKFLYDHKHATPFEMAGMVVEVKAPLMVFREWHRHRTQSYNEMSARYTPLPDENYAPTVERCMVVNANNKQANKSDGAGELTHELVLEWLSLLDHSYQVSQIAYEFGLKVGIPKELARLSVPVARYSKMRACANLRNWTSFLTLRCDNKAQYEIRVYANALADMLRQVFPRTMELFDETWKRRG